MVIQSSWYYGTKLFLKLAFLEWTGKKIHYNTIVNAASPKLEGSRGRCSSEAVRMAIPSTTGTWAAPGSFAV